MKTQIDYSLYLVTDRELMSSATIEESVSAAINGGCTIVQLREKSFSREFYNTAKSVHEITKKAGVPLIINNNVDIALAVNAEGVHIGQADLPCEIVRKIVGEKMIIGVSASSLTEGEAAVNAGADYLGVGAMFATGTKSDAKITSLDELRAIRAAVSLPIVVIGGINKSTVPLFKGIGIDGIAVVSAIVSANDVAAAAREMKSLFEEYCR